jgi:hypothetical protein
MSCAAGRAAATDFPQADFEAIYDGYRAAVDWPTAACWRELADAYRDATVVLSTRPADSWAASFSATILSAPESWPEPARRNACS